MWCFVHIEYVATLAHAVNVCEGKFDVTFIEYVATLAHVVNVPEHKPDVTLIEYVVTLAHTPKKKYQKMEAKSHGGTNETVGSGREASSGGKMLPSQVPFWKNFPKCLWQSWEKMLLSRLGMGFLRSTGISNFFPGVEKKWSFRLHEIPLYHFELAHAVQNDIL